MQPTAQPLVSLRLRTTSNGRLNPSLRFDRSGRQQVAERRPTIARRFQRPVCGTAKTRDPEGRLIPMRGPNGRTNAKPKSPLLPTPGRNGAPGPLITCWEETCCRPDAGRRASLLSSCARRWRPRSSRKERDPFPGQVWRRTMAGIPSAIRAA